MHHLSSIPYKTHSSSSHFSIFMEEQIMDTVPSYFLCPISMQLMKDPVTVATGITYDRDSIERWLFSCRAAKCPVTNQDISGTDLIPNHTLRRLIQDWCTANAVDRIPTPKPPVDASQVLKLLRQAKDSPKSEIINSLQKLRSIACRGDGGRKHLKAAGTAEFLASVVVSGDDAGVVEEALNILQQMELSDSDFRKLLAGEFLESLIRILANGGNQSRLHAIVLLKSIFFVADPDVLIGSEPELFRRVTRVLADRISPEATRAALEVLLEVCRWGKNRIKAAQNGAVWVVVETLLETGSRRLCELALAVLDQVCGCAEGRAELVRHAAGVAVVSKKILRVSRVASDRAVRILCWLSRHAGSGRVVKEMADAGVAAKLCLVVKVESDNKIKERAKEILCRHSRVWKDSDCVPPQLLLFTCPNGQNI